MCEKDFLNKAVNFEPSNWWPWCWAEHRTDGWRPIRDEVNFDSEGEEQGWEFAHLISERIIHFLPKNDRLRDSLKKMSNSLICSFLVSDLSDSLTIAHFLWAMWANSSWLLIFGERPGGFAHIAHLIWAKWAIRSHRSEDVSDLLMIALQKRGNERTWAIHSFFNNFFYRI